MIDVIKGHGSIQPVELKEFHKICLRRKDLCKLVTHFDTLTEMEQKDYKKNIKGAFVRVTYARTYVVGLIDDMIVGSEAYKVEQRETKTQIVLRNGKKYKQFKLGLISDQYVTESEFKKCQRDNRFITIDKEYIN